MLLRKSAVQDAWKLQNQDLRKLLLLLLLRLKLISQPKLHLLLNNKFNLIFEASFTTGLFL
jgi:hypothetical protein